MAKCQFCGQEVPEGQKCNCPESLSAVSSPQSQGIVLEKPKPQEVVVENTEPQNTVSENPENTNTDKAQPQEPSPVSGQTPVNETVSQTAENASAVQQEPQPESAAQNTAAGSKISKNQGIAIGAIAAAVLFIIIAASSVMSNAYKKPIDRYFKGIMKEDAELVVSSMFDKKMIKDSDLDYDDYCEDTEIALDRLMDNFDDEYGDHVKIKYKIEKKRDIRKRKLDDYEDRYDSYYDMDVKIKKGYEITLDLDIKGSDDDKDTEYEVYLFKISGHGWKMYPVSFSGLY